MPNTTINIQKGTMGTDEANKKGRDQGREPCAEVDSATHLLENAKLQKRESR